MTSYLRRRGFFRCPHCGLSESCPCDWSGDIRKSIHWSDGRIGHYMFPCISPIQECKRCKRLFFLEKDNCHPLIAFVSRISWALTYEETLDIEKRLRSSALTADQEMVLYKLLVLGYNDVYQRGYERTGSDESYERFKHDARHLISLLPDTPKNSLAKAEFYREAGDYERCLEILDGLDEPDTDVPRTDGEFDVVGKVRELAHKKQSYVFRIYIDFSRKTPMQGRRECEDDYGVK